MKNRLLLIMLLLMGSLSFTSCNKTQLNESDDSTTKDTYVKDHFDKKEVTIEMRDGIKLHTTVYSPKDTSKSYPILLKRTPYSCKPYGENEYPIEHRSKQIHDETRVYRCLSRCKRSMDE